jgi:membrane protein YdbS with pleckstrin-like domain
MLVMGMVGIGAAATGLVVGYRSGHGTAALVLTVLLVVAFFVLAVIKFFLVRLDWDFRWYVVTDRSLRIRQGVVRFEESTLTFANVQNVSIRQGPLERWFGFANVLVETAGGGGSAGGGEAAISVGGHRGLIRGLENAEYVRDLIRAAVVKQGGSGLGDSHEQSATRGAAVPLSAATPALRQVLDEMKALRAAVRR